MCDAFNSCFGQMMFLYIAFAAALLSITGYQTLQVKYKKLEKGIKYLKR